VEARSGSDVNQQMTAATRNKKIHVKRASESNPRGKLVCTASGAARDTAKLRERPKALTHQVSCGNTGMAGVMTLGMVIAVRDV